MDLVFKWNEFGFGKRAYAGKDSRKEKEKIRRVLQSNWQNRTKAWELAVVNSLVKLLNQDLDPR